MEILSELNFAPETFSLVYEMREPTELACDVAPNIA